MLKYAAHHYDDQLTLRIPPLLWVSILYGIRHFFIVGMSLLMPVDMVAVPWLNMQANALMMLADVPAFLVLVSVGHRAPDGHASMHWVWKRGRGILVASYMIAISLFVVIHNDVMFDLNAWSFSEGVLVIAIDIAFLLYLYFSRLVRDVFNDLPDRQPSPVKGG